MNIALPSAVNQVLGQIIAKKQIVIAAAAIGLLVFTVFSTYTQLFPEADEAETERLRSETVFTEFNQEGISAIENLIQVGQGIESEFDPDRDNPFAE